MNARTAGSGIMPVKSSFIRNNAAWVGAVCMLILIFARPQQAVEGGQRAMRLWYTGVAPAMLPFLALMPIITGPEACNAYRKMFSGIMKKLFRLPGEAAPAVIAAMISGSPGGAVTVCEMLSSGGFTNAEAVRIALACSGVSPAWLVLGVGCGMLGSKADGLKLAAIQVVVQFSLLKLLEKVEIPGTGNPHQPAPGSAGMWRAVESTLGVCGYMVVFGAAGSVLASFAGKYVSAALLAVLDLPTGLAEITAANFTARPLAIGGALGFGGICIGMQNLERLSGMGVRRRDYFAVRALSASVTAMMAAIWLRSGAHNAAEGTNSVRIYAFSLLGAAIFSVPGMIFLSKNIFLNIRRMPENVPVFDKKRN